MENKNQKIWEKDFTERDILDDFDIFIIYGTHKKTYYSLSGIINEFIDYIDDDIRNIYKDRSIQVEIKKHIMGICFKNKNRLLDKYGE